MSVDQQLTCTSRGNRLRISLLLRSWVLRNAVALGVWLCYYPRSRTSYQSLKYSFDGDTFLQAVVAEVDFLFSRSHFSRVGAAPCRKTNKMTHTHTHKMNQRQQSDTIDMQ